MFVGLLILFVLVVLSIVLVVVPLVTNHRTDTQGNTGSLVLVPLVTTGQIHKVTQAHAILQPR